MAEGLSDLIDMLRAAAEPTRLRLLAICAEGELTVSEITKIVGQSQPRVSRHLKLLCNAGLLIRFREGHFVLYRVPATGKGAAMVEQLLGQLSQADELLEMDSARLEIVKRDRARRVADLGRVNSGSSLAARDTNDDDFEMDRAIVRALDMDRIGDLLDIGTGTGRMLKLLGHHSKSAIGIDSSPRMLAIARNNLHAAGLGRVMVRQGDMYGMPFPDESFHTVTVDCVLHLTDDPGRVINEASRVLGPDGRLLVVDFSRGRDSGPDSSGLDKDDLKEWFALAGLRSLEFRLLRRKPQDILIAVAEPLGRGNG